MKNIKETIIGVFAVIGFVVIASGFTTNNATQQPTYGTPESHVWKGISSASDDVFIYNTITGSMVVYQKKGMGVLVNMKNIINDNE